MFEKEAEEYANKEYEMSSFVDHYGIADAFQEGAEFGYNKANEWNYVKGGIFPKDEKDILCQINFETYEVGYYHQEKRCFYTIDGREIDVIAWKEIVFPKEDEIESEMFPEITLPEGSSEFIDKVIADAEKRVKEI